LFVNVAHAVHAHNFHRSARITGVAWCSAWRLPEAEIKDRGRRIIFSFRVGSCPSVGTDPDG
jgi:hypothetical protein